MTESLSIDSIPVVPCYRNTLWPVLWQMSLPSITGQVSFYASMTNYTEFITFPEKSTIKPAAEHLGPIGSITELFGVPSKSITGPKTGQVSTQPGTRIDHLQPKRGIKTRQVSAKPGTKIDHLSPNSVKKPPFLFSRRPYWPQNPPGFNPTRYQNRLPSGQTWYQNPPGFSQTWY